MSNNDGAAASLRAVPEGGTDSVPANGLTASSKQKGSRFISDVIVELGFLARERVDAAVEEGKASGRSPEQVLIEPERSPATSSHAPWRSGSASTTST